MNRVLVDIRQWTPTGFTGVGQVARNATIALLANAPQTEFVLVGHPNVVAKISSENAIGHPCNVLLSSHPQNELFEQMQIPLLCKQYNADRFLSFENRVPIRGNFFKSTWIHDASISRFPKSHPFQYIALLQANLFISRMASHHFFCPSEFSKLECETLFGVNPSRISVAPLGSSGLPVLPRTSCAERFFLCVGATNPRKNLHRLLEAFSCIPVDTESPLFLYVTGSKKEWSNISKDFENCSERIRFLGHVTDQKLSELYSTCSGVVFPSLYEGFGIPLLDSFAANAPIACSDIPPHREILDRGAIWFDPHSVDSLLEALTRLAGNEGFRASLVKEFSWDLCAQAMLAKLN